MGVPGWQLTISTGTYHTPSVCSSCLGPRETQVEAEVSEKRGNMRHTLRMAFPYCNACADRAKREKRRAGLVIGGGAALGLLLAIVAGAGMAGEIIEEPIVAFVVAVLIAAGMAAGIAFATRPAMPPAPATARGEAVILRSTDGVLLCTNQRFAELLGNANGATPKPGSTIMTTETWAPLAALLVGALVVLLWARYAPYTFRSRPAPPPPRVTATAPPQKPAAPPQKPAPQKPAQPSKR